jgi:hypothetical protein
LALKKKEYFVVNVLEYLPGKKIPDEFYTFIETMQSVVPSPSFWGKSMKLAAGKSDEAKRMCLFGQNVWDAHSRAKRVVNNNCNPHWKKVNLAREVWGKRFHRVFGHSPSHVEGHTSGQGSSISSQCNQLHEDND